MCSIHHIIGIIKEWQDLSAGILGFTAAIFVVYMTLTSESRRDKKDLLSLRRALTAEVFQFATLAFDAHKRIKELAAAHGSGTAVTVHDLEEATRFPDPVIYPNTASRLGSLGDHANDVVLFFSQIQVMRAGVARIRRDAVEEREVAQRALEMLRAEGTGAPLIKRPIGLAISRENADDITEKLLIAAETSIDLLPHLSRGTIDAGPVSHFRRAVQAARTEWGKNRFEFQEMLAGD